MSQSFEEQSKDDVIGSEILSIPVDPALQDQHLRQTSSEETTDERHWLSRHKTAVSLGVLAAGTAVTLLTSPVSSLEHDIEKVAPWSIGGVLATELAWEAGAGMMLSGVGRKIGNPLTIRGRWSEVAQNSVDSKLFKAGLVINTIGALGLSGVLIAGASKLPVETWPGAAGLIGLDLLSTVAVRAPLIKSIQDRKLPESADMVKSEKQSSLKASVRHATLSDMERLADIDLLLFDKAYGQDKPEKTDVIEMLTKRYNNNPDWMFVSEVDGEIEGFVSAFRTSKPLEEFISWEESTADGTLDGKIDPNGKYVYVTNMTIKHEAVELGAEDMLLANLFANAINDGIEYGYFVSRMPYFKRWAENNNLEPQSNPDMQRLAAGYMQMRTADGKRYDNQLKMYEGYGFKLKRLVGGGFDDDASLGFGVVFKAEVPPYKEALRIKPILWTLSHGLRHVAKHPKILNKVL